MSDRTKAQFRQKVDQAQPSSEAMCSYLNLRGQQWTGTHLTQLTTQGRQIWVLCSRHPVRRIFRGAGIQSDEPLFSP